MQELSDWSYDGKGDTSSSNMTAVRFADSFFLRYATGKHIGHFQRPDGGNMAIFPQSGWGVPIISGWTLTPGMSGAT
jgi:hypothetical protein